MSRDELIGATHRLLENANAKALKKDTRLVLNTG